MTEQTEPETRGFPTKQELLVLADYFEEQGDPRAEIARSVDPHYDFDYQKGEIFSVTSRLPDTVCEPLPPLARKFQYWRQWVDDTTRLLQLLTESDRHEASCVFAERALASERKRGREPEPQLWAGIAAKRAWLRGELTTEQLEVAHEAAREAADEKAKQYPHHVGGVNYPGGAILAAATAVLDATTESEKAADTALCQLPMLAWREAAENARRSGLSEELEIEELEVLEGHAALTEELHWLANWIMTTAWGGRRGGT
jgi:hypothetical protein